MLVLKIALTAVASLTGIGVFLPYYFSYKGVITNPFTQNDSDYKLDEAPKCDLALNKTQCVYQDGYCYKNIHNLVKKLKEENPEVLKHAYAVFIASPGEAMFTWMQIGGKGKLSKVRYNYHVVLLYSKDKRSWIFDFDSTLNFPEELKSYCRQTFRTESIYLEGFQPVFRVIKADDFLRTFDPEREGLMLQKIEDSLIHKYVKMVPGQAASEKYGVVLNRFQFYKRFAYATKPKKE